MVYIMLHWAVHFVTYSLCLIKVLLATAKAPLHIGSVHLFVSLFVLLSVCLSKCIYKKVIFSKTEQFRAMVSIYDL